MKPLITVMTAALLASATAHAAELAPEDDVGALNGPVAFLNVCDTTKEAARIADGAPASEAESMLPLVALGASFCAGVVQSVAQTIIADPNYRLGGERVCISPSVTVNDVLEGVRGMIEEDPSMKDATAPQAVLYAWARLSSCPS